MITKLFSILPNWHANLFGMDLPKKMDQHTGGMRLTHGPKHRKDNQSQRLKQPCRIYRMFVTLDDYSLSK